MLDLLRVSIDHQSGECGVMRGNAVFLRKGGCYVVDLGAGIEQNFARCSVRGTFCNKESEMGRFECARNVAQRSAI
jgi:hypothetical protein